MKKILSVAVICVLGAMTFASCSHMTSNEKQPAGITKSDVDSVSYMLGYSFGMQLSQNDFGALNIDAIGKGMKDAVAKKEVSQQDFYNVVNGFLEKKMKIVSEANVKEAEEFFEKNIKAEGVDSTETGLQYKVVRQGNGVFPTSVKDTVEVNYEGTTLDGEVFDSSYEAGQTVKFPLSGVIKGWGEGLQLIDEGGEITLWIPSELAYGERGAGAMIGPNKALKFKVELIKVLPFVETEETESEK